MPPQAGTFNPYHPPHKPRGGHESHYEMDSFYSTPGLPSTSRAHHGAPGTDDMRRDKKRKDLAVRLSKELTENKDEAARRSLQTISALQGTAMQLSTRPETLGAFHLRLYPLSLERTALLAQTMREEEYAMDGARQAWEEERERVEDEFRRGSERIRERLLEGVEERRRRAREEKDGEGVVDASMDSQSRGHITRKLRNKIGSSPPPSPYTAGGIPPMLNGSVVQVPNPNSLSIDELPSPFPLPLMASHLPTGMSGTGGRRKQKGNGVQSQAYTGLGKSIAQLVAAKEIDIESDLVDIRRHAKRRRTAATVAMARA